MSATTTDDELLDEAGVARVTRTTARMARRIIAERRVPVIKVGRYVRVRRSDLEAWLEANTQPAVARR
ncbi:helix-turn-helix domain-containing protein [uncultured Microbacterium sp.]|uniref:helix-turn-helix domain-containing protein n=1 Tax=uncultured Microbacterium sp. TaxID=191216 RepID=UPI0028EF27F4|nr:helix-turn-helix domain-containing protein [uncultured Microbacterium sp.]